MEVTSIFWGLRVLGYGSKGSAAEVSGVEEAPAERTQ